MKNILRAVYEPLLGCAAICCFMLCTGSKELPPAAAVAVISPSFQVPTQDTATKGEIMLTKVIPAMRKGAERNDDAAYSIIQAKVKRQDKEISELRDKLQETEQYVVVLLTRDSPMTNDYEAADPCPTDTVKLYYKKTVFGKLKPIKEP